MFSPPVRHDRFVAVGYITLLSHTWQGRDMSANVIGVVSPRSNDSLPDGPGMYPNVKFIARGVGVKALTPEGYDGAWDAIVPAAVELARQGATAILVHGASL